MDWRPLVGLRPADAGSLVERVLARHVLAEAIEEHNAATRR